MRFILSLLLTVFLFAAPTPVSAEIQRVTVNYTQAGTALEGYLVYDDSFSGKRPGILLVHDWWGVGPYIKVRAQQLAQLGYVAFAADIYGKGIRPTSADQAALVSSTFKADRYLLRQRAQSGLDELRRQPLVDQNRVAAIGYCFGGMTVLELARSGADLQGVASFHGNLDAAPALANAPIKTKLLILHGADDPVAPAAQRSAFEAEMNQAHADWQLNIYSGVRHNFTNPDAGASYNRQADKRSFEALQIFLRELFAEAQ